MTRYHTVERLAPNSGRPRATKKIVITTGRPRKTSTQALVTAEAAGASRSEESSEWQYPHDLVALAERTFAALESPSAAVGGTGAFSDGDVPPLAQQLLDDDPECVGAALVAAHERGASDEQQSTGRTARVFIDIHQCSS